MEDRRNPYLPPQHPMDTSSAASPRKPLRNRLVLAGLTVVILVTFGAACEWIALQYFGVSLL
jgi:hypothetical protein